MVHAGSCSSRHLRLITLMLINPFKAITWLFFKPKPLMIKFLIFLIHFQVDGGWCLEFLPYQDNVDVYTPIMDGSANKSARLSHTLGTGRVDHHQNYYNNGPPGTSVLREYGAWSTTNQPTDFRRLSVELPPFLGHTSGNSKCAVSTSFIWALEPNNELSTVVDRLLFAS